MYPPDSTRGEAEGVYSFEPALGGCDLKDAYPTAPVGEDSCAACPGRV